MERRVARVRAHLFALPNKIGMTEAQYFIAQSVYQGWSLLAVVLTAAATIAATLNDIW